MDRICLFIQSQRGIDVADALLKDGHSFSHIFVQENKIAQPALRTELDKFGDVVHPAKGVNQPEFVQKVKDANPNLIIIAGFAEIFKSPLLTAAKNGSLNLHSGPLPAYRGGSPMNWQIIHGKKELGISIIIPDEGIDTGAIVANDNFTLKETETIQHAQAKANKIFSKLICKVVKQIEGGTLKAVPQDEKDAIYWHQRNDEDGCIDWRSMTAENVHNLVRAITHPYKGAFGFVEDQKVRIFKTSLPPQTIKGVPGRICFLEGSGPFIICADKAVLIEEYCFESDSSGKLHHGQRFKV